jgi:hypothetical protein
LKFTESVTLDAPPAMKTATFSYPLPAMIKVELEVSHVANTYNMIVVLSLDLVLRD